jgi:hypothetical protein
MKIINTGTRLLVLRDGTALPPGEPVEVPDEEGHALLIRDDMKESRANRAHRSAESAKKDHSPDDAAQDDASKDEN